MLGLVEQADAIMSVFSNSPGVEMGLDGHGERPVCDHVQVLVVSGRQRAQSCRQRQIPVPLGDQVGERLEAQLDGLKE